MTVIVGPGSRVQLVRCADEYTSLRSGAQGTVTFVDSVGTVHVAWDDGARLGLVPGVDAWVKIEERVER